MEVETAGLRGIRASLVYIRGACGGYERGRRRKPRREVGAMKTQLYRHYDSNKKLLYVGISLSAVNRLAQHRDTSHWFSDIANIEIETFSTREEALLAERKAIVNENPVCNIHHKRTLKEIEQEEKLRAAEFAQKAKQQLFTRYVSYNLTYRFDELPRILGVSKRQIDECVKQGQLYTFETEPRQSRHRKIVMVSGWALIDFLEFLEAKGKKQ